MLRNCSSEVPKEPTSMPGKQPVFEYLHLGPIPLSLSSPIPTLEDSDDGKEKQTEHQEIKDMTIFLFLHDPEMERGRRKRNFSKLLIKCKTNVLI